MNIEQAKQIRLYDLMAHLGYAVTHTANGGDDIWYYSPFRAEKTPSFHISLKFNCWFDFAESSKGDHNSIIDFACKYKGTNVKGALAWLRSLKIQPSPVTLNRPQAPSLFEPQVEIGPSKVEVTAVIPLYSFPLKKYITEERGIHIDLATKYLQEVKYKLLDGPSQGKEFYSVGFKNRSGGWALRNRHFKTATKPNDITVIERGSDKVCVYEGFMNFLSHLYIASLLEPNCDIVILNSNSLKEMALEFIKRKEYAGVFMFLDSDAPGKKTLDFFKANLPRVKDCSDRYAGYNDFNDYLLNVKRNTFVK